MRRASHPAGLRCLVWGLLLLCGGGAPRLAGAQSVAFTPLVRAHTVEDMVAVDGRLYGGLIDGGILVWDPAAPAAPTHWTRRDGLTAHDVTGLAWSGRHLWVATGSGGLTRVDPATDPPVVKRYTSSIGSLSLTCVAGGFVGESEVVYYGLAEGGIGVINAGQPGPVYTAEPYGLIDDRVTSAAVFRGQLFVGTEAGISRLEGTLFSDQVTGLPNLYVRTLLAAGDTLLLAGTQGGVARWDPDAERWSRVGDLTGWIDHVRVSPGEIWALRNGGAADVRLQRWDGAAWTAVPLPAGDGRALAVTDRPWIAGSIQEAAMSDRTARAFLARRDGGGWESWTVEGTLLRSVGAVAVGGDGTIWLGSYTGQAVSAVTGDDWFHVSRVATAENDSSGLFGFGANIFTMAARGSREVWIAQRDRGLLRVVRGSGGTADVYEHLTAENSGLNGLAFTRLVLHPDGPLFVLTEDAGADLLLDPDDWRNADRWLDLPTDDMLDGGLRGESVWDVAFVDRDAVWFAVREIGLVRWDPNGSAAATADLTWDDAADDVWSSPVNDLGAAYDFDAANARALLAEPDGTFWAGGDGGLVHLRDRGPDLAPQILGYFDVKEDVFTVGLLTGTVTDLARDGNGDLWVATEAGLNRIRVRGDETTIDAYADLGSYFTPSFGLGALYSDQAIADLAGGEIYRLARGADGQRLVAGSSLGATLIQVAAVGTARADPLDPLYLYPNPFDAGEAGEGLKLGGIVAEVVFSGGLPQGGAAVQIFNLEGQLVYRQDNVAADEGFWDGRNRLGQAVAAGLYVVKVRLEGRDAVKTLAVLR